MKIFPTTPLRFPNLVKWLETTVLTLVPPLSGYLLNPTDPLFVHSEFPWLWFGPLLVALRYGVAPALTSVSLLILLRYGAFLGGLDTTAFPLHFMLGGALMALIAGQFSNVWSTRLRRSDLLSRHAAERFEQLSHAYFMVRYSHDRLEQNLVSRPVTLRQAMVELRRLLDEGGGATSRELVHELLVLLAHYCSLSSAAIYAVHNGVPEEEPLATCGQGAALRKDDLMLRSALESAHTAFQTANRLKEGEESSYLAVAPIRTSSGHVLGLLLVSEMPFMALHRETIQIMGVLLAYSADNIEAADIARSITSVYPDCPTDFGAELVKMTRMRRELDIISTLAVINLESGPRCEEICQLLERQQRGLDHGWRRTLDWGCQFVTLMPFSGTSAAEGYQMRLDSTLKKQCQSSLQSPGISFKSTPLTGDEPVRQLAGLFAEVH